MAPTLSEKISVCAIVFFASESPLGIERQKKLKIIYNITEKPRSHIRILIYRGRHIATHRQT